MSMWENVQSFGSWVSNPIKARLGFLGDALIVGPLERFAGKEITEILGSCRENVDVFCQTGVRITKNSCNTISKIAHYAIDQQGLLSLWATFGVGASSALTASEIFRIANKIACNGSLCARESLICPIIIYGSSLFLTGCGVTIIAFGILIGRETYKTARLIPPEILQEWEESEQQVDIQSDRLVPEHNSRAQPYTHVCNGGGVFRPIWDNRPVVDRHMSEPRDQTASWATCGGVTGGAAGALIFGFIFGPVGALIGLLCAAVVGVLAGVIAARNIARD